jgi:hypothetical protein
MRSYLDFEKPVAELEAKADELRGVAETSGSPALAKEIEALDGKARQQLRELYAALTPWQKTMVARHPMRPHCADYLQKLVEDFSPLAGDRSFGEDEAGLALLRDFDLADNFLWANDFPHHEGTWPHSAAAIERTMGRLSDVERAKVLGENAARIFGFEIPARYR